MPDIIKEFQEKHHPCAKCCVYICCTMKCPEFNEYHNLIYETIRQYISMETKNSVIFSFCVSKLYYFDVTDYEAKVKILIHHTDEAKGLSSNSSLFKTIVKNLIKRF